MFSLMRFVVRITTNFRKIGVEKHRVSGAAWVLYDRIFHGPCATPQPKDWGYINKARLRGLNFIKERNTPA